VRLEATDAGDLLVQWLNEVVYLVETRRVVPGRFEFRRLEEAGLEAVLLAAPVGAAALGREIKSATRHDLEVKKVGSGWRARVLLDV